MYEEVLQHVDIVHYRGFWLPYKNYRGKRYRDEKSLPREALKKTTLHGGQSRSWSAEQGKKEKRKSLGTYAHVLRDTYDLVDTVCIAFD